MPDKCRGLAWLLVVLKAVIVGVVAKFAPLVRDLAVIRMTWGHRWVWFVLGES